VRSDGDYENVWSKLARWVVKRNPTAHLLLSGGSWSGWERNHLFLNKAGQQFEEMSGLSGLDDISDSRSYVIWDYDHDGWQDVAVINRNSPQLRLFRNQIGDLQSDNSGQVIAVRLVGSNHAASPAAGKSSRDGYGARVSVSLGDRKLTREHICGQGLAAQNSATLVIGIGAEDVAKELTIRWPSGVSQSVPDVPARSLVTVYEDAEHSPTGEAFVIGEYRAVEIRTPSVEESEEESPRLAIRATPGSVNNGSAADGSAPGDAAPSSAARPKLRIYTTMATSCVACARKLPAVNQMRDRFENEELAMFGIPVDEEDDGDALAAWAERMQPAYELLTGISPEEVEKVQALVRAELKSEVLPAAIVTDAEGRVLHVQGGLPSTSKILELLEKTAN